MLFLQNIRFSNKKTRLFFSFLLLNLFFFSALSCSSPSAPPQQSLVNDSISNATSVPPEPIDTIVISEIEKTFISYQLVDVQSLDSSIRVNLKYASTDNFLDTNIYGTISKAYLQKEVAEKLVIASQHLKTACDSCRLLILDAARPQSVQYKMWDKIKSMPVQQGVYVSNPSKGSVHNFGSAVDLTIVLTNGKELDMGTPFDFFGKEAWITAEDSLIRIGKLTKEQVANRKLLRHAMQKASFRAIPSEWWHFNAYSRGKAQELYKIIK